MAAREKLVDLLTEANSITRELSLRQFGDNLSRYNTGDKIHKKQIEFHKCLKRNRWVFGGNRSGKTECGAVEAIWQLRGTHPYRKNKQNVIGWVVSVSTKVQRSVAQAKILYYLPPRYIEKIVMLEGSSGAAEYGVIDFIVVRNAFGGTSTLYFKSCEQTREKFQGASIDFVWFDEEPPEDIYNECRMRVMDRRGEIWGTMTPLKGLSWVYERIFLSSDSEVWHTSVSWLDNPFLPRDEVEYMLKSMSDDELDSRCYGNFRANSGLVYREFDESVHVIDPFDVPREWQDNISIDPGLNNPLSCHFYAVDYDGNIYVVAEHYEAMQNVDYHATQILALAERLGWKKESDGKLSALIDSAANQRTLSGVKSVAELFFERGINVNTRVNKELFSGISRLKSLFSARPARIMIFRNCVNLIRELKSYWWGDGDTPVKRDDHALDELRYYVMNKPQPKQRTKNLSVIEKDKLTLARKNRMRISE